MASRFVQSYTPALRSRNFRLFWVAQIFSTFGASLQVIAEGYLIYDLTESTFWLGAVGFVALLPVVPISLAGAVLIDRYPRRKLIMLTQGGLMLQALIFATLAATGRLDLVSVILLYFVFGALMAIDHPARRAFLVELVPRDDLANAVALNATLFNVASVVGFAAGGVLIATTGVSGAMTVNAVTYLFPIVALALIKVRDIGRDQEKRGFGMAMSEGFVMLWQQPVLLGVIGLMAVVGGLAYPVFVGMMPAYAEQVMGVGSVGLGILMSSAALGSVLGTFGAARMGARQRGRNLVLTSILLPVLAIGVAQSPNIYIACLLLVGVGFVLLVLQSLAVTLVQLNTPDRIRGRVMTIYSMVHAGADTGSNMVMGTIAVPLGLPAALTLGGLLAFAFATVLNFVLPGVRRLE